MPRLNITVELNVRDAEDFADVSELLGELLKWGTQAPDTVSVRVPMGPATDLDQVEAPRSQFAGQPGVVSPPPLSSSPKRVRDKKAERAARVARDAAAGGAVTNGASVATPLTPEVEADPLGGVDLMTPPLVSAAVPVTAAPPAALAKPRTEQGNMDAALTVLRQIYDSKDGASHVKALQKQYKIAKFTDLPLSEAPALFKAAFALAQSLGVSLPGNL